MGAASEVKSEDLDKFEELALEKANKCVSTIENAIAVWENSKEKPKDMKAKIDRLRYFREALMRWQKRTLETKGDDDKKEERIRRLREFSDLCHRYVKV